MNVATMNSVKPVPPVRLHPKEHGAYAIVGVPLVTALIITGINVVALLTIIATVAGFLANEPLMVYWGQRGKRAQRIATSAGSRLLTLLFVAVLAGAIAFWLGSSSVRLGLAACLIFAVAGLVLSATGWQRTLTAQLTGIIGLTLPTTVVLLAGGLDDELALRLSSAWVLGRICTTIAVRSMVARQRAVTHHRVPQVNDVILFLAVVACAAGTLYGFVEWMLISPLAVTAIYLRIRPPATKHLGRVGYTLLSLNVGCALWMIVWCA